MLLFSSFSAPDISLLKSEVQEKVANRIFRQLFDGKLDFKREHNKNKLVICKLLWKFENVAGFLAALGAKVFLNQI